MRLAGRLLVLVLLCAGVAGMHTMGHPQPGHTAPSATHAQAHMVSADGMTAASPTKLPAGMQMSPGEVCLAVLTVVVLILLPVTPRHAVRLLADGHAAPAGAPRATGRDPPRYPSCGLTLADLAVSRT